MKAIFNRQTVNLTYSMYVCRDIHMCLYTYIYLCIMKSLQDEKRHFDADPQHISLDTQILVK